MLLLIVSADIFWWLKISVNADASLQTIKATYYAIYPEFLQQRGIIELVSIGALMISVILFVLSRENQKRIWLKNTLISICFLCIAWRFFSLL